MSEKIILELSGTEALTLVLCMRVILDLSRKVDIPIEQGVLMDMETICNKILMNGVEEKTNVN